MSTPEIDWTNDEAVVRAALSERFRASPSSITRGPHDWSVTRSHPDIVKWEAIHRPHVPGVDVEKELYLALKRLYDWTGIVPSDLSELVEYAIRLYEAKGRL